MDEVFATIAEAQAHKKAECIRIYAGMTANLQQMGKDVGKLMRHPDANAAHMTRAHDAYAGAFAEWLQIRDQLREKYPQPRATLITLPWWQQAD